MQRKSSDDTNQTGNDAVGDLYLDIHPGPQKYSVCRLSAMRQAEDTTTIFEMHHVLDAR
jgi:hypothetical protein